MPQRVLLRLLYPAFGVGLLALYMFYAATGRDVGSVRTYDSVVPPEARVAGPGFRVSPTFWNGGYAGGK
jgi:hypothetical protein